MQKIYYLSGRSFEGTHPRTKYAPKLFAPGEQLAFNVTRRTLVLLCDDKILCEQLLTRNEAHLFHLLYLNYPECVEDDEMRGVLLADDPETYYQHRRSDRPPSQVPLSIEKALLGLRKKLRECGLYVGRLFKAGYYLCRDRQPPPSRKQLLRFSM